MREVTQHERAKIISKIKMVALIAVVVIVLILSMYQVPSGHRGVLTTFGSVNLDEKDEGFGFKIPFAQKVVDIEVRTQKIEVKSDASSKDLQDVQTTVALNYYVVANSAAELYQEIGDEYRERIIQPAMEETIKSVSAKYTAEELISKRSEVRVEMREVLKDRLVEYHISANDFNIVNFQFSPEFDKAIEAKVTAEQLKLKAERDLERIKIEKEQKITQAQAEAESIRIQNDALAKNQDVLKLRWIEKWNGVTPKVISDSSSLVNIGIED